MGCGAAVQMCILMNPDSADRTWAAAKQLFQRPNLIEDCVVLEPQSVSVSLKLAAATHCCASVV